MNTSSHALARLLGDWSAGPGPAHRRLTDLIRLLILDGRLPLATAMPGERDLAAVLGISRTTVSTAYAALREQGYLNARDRSRSLTRVPPGNAQPEAQGGSDLIDFSHAAPPAPGEALHRAYTKALDQLPLHLPRHGYSPMGLTELRVAIAQRFTDRGLPTSPDQILVTNGAQHALSLIARTLLRPRDRVVVDHPTYPHALRVFADARCRIVPVAVTDSWDLESLSAATRGAAMAYLTPDFHNPTGLCLPADDRIGLHLDCPRDCRRDNGRARSGRRPADSLGRAPAPGHHNRLTAKLFWGGLRVGWVRADADLVQQLGQARAVIDLGTPVVEQLACVELLGEVDKILIDRLAGLRDRRALLRSLVADLLPDWTIGPSVGGLSVWAQLPEPTSSALAAVAPQFGVRLAAGPRFGIGGAFERFVRLPYSQDAAAMTAGLKGIAAAFAAVRAGRRADTPPAAMA